MWMLIGGICGIVAFICVPLVFVLISIYGGSAFSGHHNGNDYFLFNHGVVQKVSSTIYYWILILEWASIISVGGFITTGIFFLIKEKLFSN
jgi:hypothetical protein